MALLCLHLVIHVQVGRAGRFGTKGLAITFVASSKDSEILNKVTVCFDNYLELLVEFIGGFLT